MIIGVSGAAAEAVDRIVPQLVSDGVAGRIMSKDATLWGAAAEEESAKRLGWVEAPAISQGLVDDIEALRLHLNERGVTKIALAGMGGSSLAPEVITATYGVPLTVLDSTEPGQVLHALRDDLASTALVVSSKSGSTLETDSQRRIFEQWFTEAGIDPLERIIVVTDPGSPLDQSAREAGYRVFNADPDVGGRFSALTAFGLVPSGLAGVPLQELLDAAAGELPAITEDSADNPGLILAAAIAGTRPLKDKLGIVADGTHIVGFADWAEQLIAESTGKEGVGILPIVLDPESPEAINTPDDVQIVRLVADRAETKSLAPGEVEVAGTLGGQLLVWEFATAVAGRILGINPFDQPDVESAKVAARGLLDALEPPAAPAFVDGNVEVRGTSDVVSGASSTAEAVAALLAHVGDENYLAVQAYVDRTAAPAFQGLRELFAKKLGRPVTFGWGPRFLHSTGQYHKGGTPIGVFLQILATPSEDLAIPERSFSFGQLIQAQAYGDANVLAEHGRPVLTLTLADLHEGLAELERFAS
ncbi:glucose-6-phosphate isomerase [Humidisolicoccus flavus]|uniref:glucose-6-phosphate isomerase n=1 Tax=Humidisolicoccus flavus TaxID=3111414 RepID=UPI0032497C33